ncbi:MAG TPA: Bcr/CflA family multidrug efflux MFS transporter [Pelomicrobium sp.]|nr:Bcr/CflA family multidrug efflux MFS transporter [Pelomicrobium sp.]
MPPVNPLQSPAAPARANRLGLVVLLGALTAFGPLAIDMYLPAFPQMAAALGAPIGAVQLTLPVFLAGMAAGQIVYGPLSDRYGRRAPLIAGCLAFAAASAACALAGSAGALIVSRFLMGLGGAVGLVVARAVVRDLYDESESARVYSLMMLVMGLAPVLAPALGALLLLAFTWESIFWVQALFGIACAIAVAAALPETLAAHHRARAHPGFIARRFAFLLGQRAYLGYALTTACCSGILFAYISGSPFVFIELFGVSPQQFGLYFGANAIGLFSAAQLNHWLLRRYTPRQVLGRAFAVNVAAAALLVGAAVSGAGGFALFYPLLFVCVATLGLLLPNAVAAAMQPFPEMAGSASALLGMLQYALGATTGALVGFLHDGTALPMAGVVAAAACAGALALALLTRSSRP